MFGDDETAENNATPDQKAAHVFLTELRTRIATERLPFGDGDEQTALQSLFTLFGFARRTIAEHHGCTKFADAVLSVMNGGLRNFTARWHRMSLSGELATRDGSVIFRSELRGLQDKLRILAADLHEMAYGTPMAAFPADATNNRAIEDHVTFGIPVGNLVHPDDAKNINKSEADELRARRNLDDDADVYDASGLALSGGGIRSASFCLGVAQLLAKKGLLAKFDLMSTVSGGGYTGAFLTRRMALGSQDDVASPDGRDEPAIQYLRRRVAFLQTGSLKNSLATAMNLLAGMIVNWTVPAAVIALVVSLLYFFVNQTSFAGLWPMGHAIGVVAAILALVAYAWLPRSYPKARGVALWVLWSIAALFAAGYLLQLGYQCFDRWMTSKSGRISLSVGALVTAAIPVVSRFLPAVGQDWLRRIGNIAALSAAAIALPLLAILLAFALYWTAGHGIALPESITSFFGKPVVLPDLLPGPWVLVAVAVFLTATAFLAIDINETGPYGHYRNRLKNTFVAFEEDELQGCSDVELSALDKDKTAPYLLINTVANLPSSDKVELRERMGDFFLFSKHWSGSPVVGYRETSRWRLGNRQVGLASAIATSGAAVAPHMALWSISSARALLSFVNLRLGLWIKRPKKDGEGSGGRPGGRELLKEMTGWGMSEEQDWLMLTDGGHLDNSGVYELLRRRCRFIVAVDGSADPDGEFDTLMTLVRHARIDMGIEIKCDLDELRPSRKTGLSPAHGVLCEVIYPEHSSTTCLLLVIKLSMTGNEPELIVSYKQRFPKFPNQPTSDQFFDEHQFEAYRRLGTHAAESLFHNVLIQSSSDPDSVTDWLTRLNRTIPPGGEIQ